MGKTLTLITGGARSGKSAFAQSLAAKLGRHVTFVATAEARDAEMEARIADHRRARPSHWRTVETPTGAAEAVRAAAGAQVIVLDCLALLVSNLLLQEEDPAGAETRVSEEIEGIIAAYEAGAAHLVVVTNEVGLGVVPAYELGRVFRDLIGRANARLAKAADAVYWMMSGLALEIKASGLATPWEQVDVRT